MRGVVTSRAMSELSHRAKQILYAAVSEFVATGEPVGSRTLSKKGIELSPATIRTVLSDLEEAGFLKQPHTSAGRVPTDRAFRLFIDALMELRELAAEDLARIESRFHSLEPGENVMRETGKLLAELAGTAAIVMTPRRTFTLRHLRFIRTARGSLYEVRHFLRRAEFRQLINPDQKAPLQRLLHELLPALNAYLRSLRVHDS